MTEQNRNAPLPLRRWSSNVLCGLSLLIFLLAMGIWVRSYFVTDVIWRQHVVFDSTSQSTLVTVRRQYTIRWDTGQVVIRQLVKKNTPGPYLAKSEWQYYRGPAEGPFARWGF